MWYFETSQHILCIESKKVCGADRKAHSQNALPPVLVRFCGKKHAAGKIFQARAKTIKPLPIAFTCMK